VARDFASGGAVSPADPTLRSIGFKYARKLLPSLG